MERLHHTLGLQTGVINRRQMHADGLTAADLQRLLRQRRLVRIHTGVFVDHTGIPTWVQRAWAAVLLYEPAALFGTSALRATVGPGARDHDDLGAVHVAVDRHRHVKGVPGVVVHRVSDFERKAHLSKYPPRMRVEEAVLDVAASASSDFDAIAVLSRALGARMTTVPRIRQALACRSRIARRRFLDEVLSDLGAGACSVLEATYLKRVERAHGLDGAARQVRASSRGPIYRDVVYGEVGVVVELDGRLDHTLLADRDRDLDRDLDAAIHHAVTVRLGWGQVVGRPCRTAHKVQQLLASRGSTRTFRACASCRE